MASGRLYGRRIAVLVEEGFSRRQFTTACDALAADGAEIVVVAPSTTVTYRDRTASVEVQAHLDAAAARRTSFDAVVIPGGYAPDRLRMRPVILDFVAETAAAGKPVAAICHGPQVLISAHVLQGRTVTCWPSIAIDVKNAGARYVDRPFVVDGPVITARKSDDLAPFLTALADAIGGTPT